MQSIPSISSFDEVEYEHSWSRHDSYIVYADKYDSWEFMFSSLKADHWTVLHLDYDSASFCVSVLLSLYYLILNKSSSIVLFWLRYINSSPFCHAVFSLK